MDNAEQLRHEPIREIGKDDELIALAFTREELDAVLENPEHTPADVLSLFDTNFHDLFEQDAGVKERYSIGRHTLMVMGQFQKYFPESRLPSGTDRKLLEIILALHDIGKGEAFLNGEKRKQHEYTKKILMPTLARLAYSPEQIAVAESLIDGDPIGSYLKGGGGRNASKFAADILEMSKRSGLPAQEFWKLLEIYYQVDAGSYTEDAGGYRGLDSLFSFDPENGKMSFAPQIAEEMKILEKEVLRLAVEEAALPDANETEKQLTMDTKKEDEMPLAEVSGEELEEKSEKLELREFTKRYSSLARSMFAKRLVRLRNEKRELEEAKAGEKENRAEILRAGVESLERELTELKEELTEQKIHIFSAFSDLKKRFSLKRDIENEERYLQAVRKNMRDRYLFMAESDGAIEADEFKKQLEEEMRMFYLRQEDIKEEFERDEKLRSVEAISKNEGVLFIHTLPLGENMKNTSQNNSFVNTEGMDFTTKIKLVLGLEPTISCSTLKKGDTRANMFYGTGLIIGKGRVVFAHNADAATVAEGPFVRRSKDPVDDYYLLSLVLLVDT